MALNNNTRMIAGAFGVFALVIMVVCAYSVVWIHQQVGRTAQQEAGRAFDRMEAMQDRFLDGLPEDAGVRVEFEAMREERSRQIEQQLGRTRHGPASHPVVRVKGAYYPGDLDLEPEGTSISAVSVIGAGLGGLFVFCLVGAGAFFGLKQLEPEVVEGELEEGVDGEPGVQASVEDAVAFAQAEESDTDGIYEVEGPGSSCRGVEEEADSELDAATVLIRPPQ